MIIQNYFFYIIMMFVVQLVLYMLFMLFIMGIYSCVKNIIDDIESMRTQHHHSFHYYDEDLFGGI